LLVQAPDVSSLGHDLHKDNTALSDLYFANLSGFYGGRTQFRKWLLTTMMPDIETLAAAITPPNEPFVVNETMIRTATERLKTLNDVCSAAGARFILVIPPTQSAQDAAAIPAIEEAGRRAGVTVLSPIAPGELAPSYFADGIHLTQEGALRFTSTLSSDLKKTMTDVLNKEQHQDTRERIAKSSVPARRG
jgi:hypothetical protein